MNETSILNGLPFLFSFCFGSDSMMMMNHRDWHGQRGLRCALATCSLPLKTTLLLCVIASAALLASPVGAAPMLIYSETFNTSEGVNATLNSVGWQTHATSSATPYNTALTSGVPFIGSLASGGGDDSGNGTGFGYLFSSLTGTNNQPVIYWTAPTGGLGDIANLVRIEADLRNSNTSEDVRLALQIDGSWFVAQPADGINNAVSNVWLDNIVMDPSAMTWRVLTFTPGSLLAVPSTTAVPLPTSGTINAFGFYDAVRNSSTQTRIDNIEVFANVPEPASLALWTLLALVGGVYVWKHRWMG